MIKLFIQNAASFDFAFLAKNSGPIGRSYHLDVVFEGKINSKGMLIDFSHAKKIVKAIVKSIDHILLVSKKQVRYETRSQIVVMESKNNFFAMHSNRSWVKVVSESLLESLENGQTNELEKFIEKEISKRIPKNASSISVKLKEKSDCGFHGNINAEEVHFYYTHSLCHHLGDCQKFHGHSAQLSVSLNNKFDAHLSTQIAQSIKGLYIVSKKHLVPLFNSVNLEKMKEYCFQKKSFEKIQNDLYALEYKGTKGKVSILISKDLSLLLPSESTIENIAQYIRDQVPAQKAVKVSVYEGLLKGALIE